MMPIPLPGRLSLFQAAWFKLLLGLMVVRGAAGGVWAGMSAAERRRRRLEEANRALEERVEERTHALSAANAEMARANADLEAFSRSVSHDLRSPLRTIGGFAALLEEERGSELGEEGTRYLRTIQDRARHMAGLIEDMLRFSRAARNALEWERLDMESLVREVWTDLQGDHPEWTPAVEIGALPGARGDRALVRQVWTNLLSNAAKFSSRVAAPAIHVGGCRRDGLSRFQVRDNGVGFDMAHRDRLFHHSVRLHATADFPGNGFGLSMVKRIVEAHGGEVGAESAPGAGAAFWFALPSDDTG